MSARVGWRRLHPAARVVIALAAVVVVVNLALGVVDTTTRGSDETAPQSSSFSTGRTGVAGWSELLRRNRHHATALRGSIAEHVLDPGATLVVLEPNAVDQNEQRAVRAFVRAGGRLVAGGHTARGLLGAVLGESPTFSAAGVTHARPRSGAAEVAGIDTVETAGDGSWDHLGGMDAILGNDGGTIASASDVAAGRVIALADPSPLQNRLLGHADNAGFALALAGDGDRAVLFAEGEHGYGRVSGIGAIPRRWQLALIGLALASLVVVVAAGRRLGPAEDEARALPPPRRAYVDAVSISLARAGRPREAFAPLQAAARTRLARRAGLPPDASDDDLRATAARLGFPSVETEALFVPPRNDDEVLAAGRALARIST